MSVSGSIGTILFFTLIASLVVLPAEKGVAPRPGDEPAAGTAPPVPGEFEPVVARRRPVACCINPAGDRLLVANAQSGTVSLINTDDLTRIGEWPAGDRLSDLIWWRDDLFLASDPQLNQLVCLQLVNLDALQVIWRSPVIASPGSLLLDVEGQYCYVAGLWSRQLAAVRLPQEIPPQMPDEWRLPSVVVNLSFCAGALCQIADPEPAILVTDAFSSHWSMRRLADLEPLAVGRNQGYRAADVAVQPETGRIFVAGQSLNPLAHANRNDVHWGMMIANHVRVYLPTTFFLQSSKSNGSGSSANLSGITIPLGGADDAKADPESIVFSNDGLAAIAVGGVDQVALGHLDGKPLAYVSVGRRPVDCRFSPDGSRLFVCNQLDDSISVVDPVAHRVLACVELGKQPGTSLVDRGERLFFDGRLSHDGWMSCHSCHVNGHSNGMLNDNLSDQSLGAPKRVLSLLGRRGTEPLAWNGSFSNLTDQVRSSIDNTMQSDEPATDEQVAAIEAYVNSLPPPPPLARTRREISADQIAAGRTLFFEAGCAECHVPDLWTSAENQDVGTIDESGNSRFNPPSLIGTGQHSAWFHDARYQRLADVFRRGGHQLDRPLSDLELQELLGFLNSL